MISEDLAPSKEEELLLFLDKNSDVFTWRTSDLTGVSRDIIEHKLEVNPSAWPRKQRLRKMSDEKITVAKAEVPRLLDAGFICKVYYSSWLANIVMVNKCCLKDDFPLTIIDKVVDSTVGCEIMALLDCFSGYH
jgi:hypothetical protein